MGNNGLWGMPQINPPRQTETDLPASAPRGARAANLLATEQLAELRAMTQTLSSIAARLAGNVYNETLATATATFDSTGQIALQFKVAAGSIRLRNLSVAATVTVYAGGPIGTTPTIGPGTWRVPAGQVDTIGLATRQITLYGTAGDSVSYSVYTTGNAPNGN
jgi:hypothetical protein